MITEYTFEEVRELRIYLNARGGVSIVEPGWLGSDESLICINNRSRLNELIEALTELGKLATFMPDKPSA
jgi:hypothetical protein